MTVAPMINPPFYKLENVEYSFSQYELVNMGHLSQNFEITHWVCPISHWYQFGNSLKVEYTLEAL